MRIWRFLERNNKRGLGKSEEVKGSLTLAFSSLSRGFFLLALVAAGFGVFGG